MYKIFNSNTIEIHQLTDIKKIGFNNKFISTSTDPYIVFKSIEKIQVVQLEIKIISKTDDEVKLYYAVDRPEFSEEDCFIIGEGSKPIEKIIRFRNPVNYIRIDPLTSKVAFKIEYFLMNPLEKIPQNYNGDCEILKNKTDNTLLNMKLAELVRLIIQGKIDPTKIIVINTHDMANSGAPLLCKKISGSLMAMGYYPIILSQGKTLEENDYEKYCYFLFYLNNVVKETATIIEELSFYGVNKGICNTVVTGNIAELLHQYGVRNLFLIHEMKSSLEILKVSSHIDAIANFANYVIFPAECVKEDFLTFNNEIRGEIRIKPQGFYKETFGVVKSEKLRNNLIEKLGITEKTIFFIGAGTITFGKGIDLFPLILRQLEQYEKELKSQIHCIWLGELNQSDYSIWLRNQISKMGLTDRVHFLGYIADEKEYLSILAASECFLLVSREDSFPSVLLESIAVDLPIVSFDKSGGASELLADDCGYLVEYFNIEKLCEKIYSIIKDPLQTQPIIKNAKNKLLKYYQFEEYVKSLIILLENEA